MTKRINIAASRGRAPLHPTELKYSVKGRWVQRLEINVGGVSNALTSVGLDNLVLLTYD